MSLLRRTTLVQFRININLEHSPVQSTFFYVEKWKYQNIFKYLFTNNSSRSVQETLQRQCNYTIHYSFFHWNSAFQRRGTFFHCNNYTSILSQMPATQFLVPYITWTSQKSISRTYHYGQFCQVQGHNKCFKQVAMVDL